MKYDEFGFFNQQLAGMLRSGIPLEGALRQLSRNMRKGRLRAEIVKLEADLREGVPFEEAISKRALPAIYVQMARAGTQSESLPGVLTLVADYYGRLHTLSSRLKGLMIYPAIILTCTIFLSALLSVVYASAIREYSDVLAGSTPTSFSSLIFWVGPFGLLLLLGLLLSALILPGLRHWLRWHFPGVKDASLAQSASTISVMLASGARLDTTLSLLQSAEEKSPAGADLAQWKKHLSEGRAKFPEMAIGSRVFPPLFVWLVAQGGEDLATGFKRAAEIYSDRAMARTDLLLFAALPMAVVVLGVVILGQAFGIATLVIRFINMF